MTEFGDTVRDRVEAARRMFAQRHNQTRAFRELVERRLREAAERSDGALQLDTGVVSSPGVLKYVWTLRWLEPLPERQLRVMVSSPGGEIEWLLSNGGIHVRKRHDPGQLSEERLVELLDRLMDQGWWMDRA